MSLKLAQTAVVTLCVGALLLVGAPMACACAVSAGPMPAMAQASCGGTEADMPMQCPMDETADSHACGHCQAAPTAPAPTTMGAVPGTTHLRQHVARMEQSATTAESVATAPTCRTTPTGPARFAPPVLRALATIVLLT